jgi:hypothetical protein
MFLATINKPKHLLHFSFIQHVGVDELAGARENVITLLAELQIGFRLLTDLGRLESMDVRCAEEIGRMMELCDEKGIGLVVRVIPDQGKDIGFNILSLFHYRHMPSILTCKNMVEAAKILSL